MLVDVARYDALLGQGVSAYQIERYGLALKYTSEQEREAANFNKFFGAFEHLIDEPIVGRNPVELSQKLKEWMNDHQQILDGVTVLDLKEYDLDGLPEEVSFCRNLQVLDISENPRIKELPLIIATLPHFEQLEAAGCNLCNLPGGENLFNKLKILNVRYNSHLIALPEHLPSLEELYIEGTAMNWRYYAEKLGAVLQDCR